MKRLASFVFVFVFAVSTPAFANPDESAQVTATTRPTGYVSLGASGGVEQLLFVGVQLDGGVHVAGPLYLRGMVESGRAAMWLDNGNYQTYRLGIEARGCATRACLFAGIDGGTRRAQLVHDFDSGQMETDHYNVGLIVPRVGIEIGTRVRGRIAFELPTAFDREDAVTGIAVGAGIGYAF